MAELREIQLTLPWSTHYSREFKANPIPHKDFAHALTHVSKAAGRLHGLVDEMDHNREVSDNPNLRQEYQKFLADLVICALRMANTFPGGVVDLERAVLERLRDKNPSTVGDPLYDPPASLEGVDPLRFSGDL